MLAIELGKDHYRLYMSQNDIDDFNKMLGKKFSPGISEWLDIRISAFEGRKSIPTMSNSCMVWTPVNKPEVCINLRFPELAVHLDHLLPKLSKG